LDAPLIRYFCLGKNGIIFMDETLQRIYNIFNKNISHNKELNKRYTIESIEGIDISNNDEIVKYCYINDNSDNTKSSLYDTAYMDTLKKLCPILSCISEYANIIIN